MNVLSLYSGIGGLDRAAEMAGMRVVTQVEPDPFCQRVLALRYPGVRIYDYDTDITADRLRADGIPAIDCIIGGPPCQSVSLAGKRLGPADERFRWPEALRIAGDINPRWVVGENVGGFIGAEKGRVAAAVFRQMAEMGYRVGWGHWGAADIGAPHRRERIFIVGRSAVAYTRG